MYDFELTVMANGSESVPYNVQGYPFYAGSSWLHKYKGMGVISHWHWDYEFAYILHGQMAYTINHDTITIGEGEGIFINSGQIHRNFSMDGMDCEYRCLLFHPSMLRTELRQTEGLLQNLSSFKLPYCILQPDVAWQKSLLDDIGMLYASVMSGVENHIFALLSHVFRITHTLLECLPETTEEKSVSLGISTMREMVGFIQTHYREKVCIGDISRAGMVGTRTCYALFKRFLNASPMKYLTDYRLSKAAELLKTTDIPVCDIADLTGFASPSYFSECFKMLYGVSPTSFRQNSI